MTLLDRYIYRLFMKNMLTVMLALVGIYLLIDFFERIDNFLEQGLAVSLAMRYFLLKIPQIIDQIMPVTIMLAGVITVGLLNHHEELSSLQAGGISILRVLRPVVLLALCFSCLSLAASQWLLPMTGRATSKIWYEAVNKETATGITRAGMIFYRGAEGFYLFGPPDDGGETFSPFTYFSWDTSYHFKQQVDAQTATKDNANWRLTNGLMKKQGKDGTITTEPFPELTVSLPEKPETLFLPEHHDAFVSVSDLLRRTRLADEVSQRHAALRLHGRLSYILLGIPLLLIGLPGLLYLIRQWRRDLSLALPVSCIIAFATWGAWGTLQSFAGAGALPVLPAAWGLHLVVGGIGAWLLGKTA